MAASVSRGGFLSRIVRRGRRFAVPLLLLDAGAIYLFATHVRLRDAAARLLDDLGRLDRLHPQSRILEQSAETLIDQSILALVLASCGVLGSLTLILAIAWSVRCLRRSRRFAVFLEAYWGSEPEPVEIIDISTLGCRVRLTSGAAPGAKASLVADGVELPPADVVWAEGGAAGLRFARPIGPQLLAVLVKGGESAGRQITVVGSTPVTEITVSTSFPTASVRNSPCQTTWSKIVKTASATSRAFMRRSSHHVVNES